MKRPSPAVVISCVALFFSLAGAGLAASRYLITSANQIKPSARNALRAGLVDWSAAYYRMGSTTLRLPNTTDRGAITHPCNAGDRVLTGGYSASSNVLVISEESSADGSTWNVNGQLLNGATSGRLTAWALCAPAS